MSVDKNTPNEEPTFPCTQCGACCRILDQIECGLPYDETGRCYYLVDVIKPDGRRASLCSVYDNRVEYGCPTLNSVKPADVPWYDYYKFMINACGLIQEQQGLDESYYPQFDLTTLLTQPSKSEE